MKTNIDILSQKLENQYLAKSLNASVSKHLLDEHFTLISANNHYYEMFGYDKEEYVKLFHNRPDLYYAKDPDDWEALTSIVVKALTNNQDGYVYVGRMRHKDGRKRWVKLVGTFIDEYMDGYQISYSVMQDITDLMQTKIEKDVTQSNFPGMIAKYKVTKDGFELLEGNQNFYNTIKEHKILLNKDAGKTSYLAAAFEKYDVLSKGESSEFTISPTGKDGQKRYLKVNAECVDWVNDNPVFLLMYNDVTDLTIQQQKLDEYNQLMHKLAYTDEVTEGYNRRKFDEVANKTIMKANNAPYCLVWLNLQKFKLINETAGVELGDGVLKHILEKICIKLKKDEFAARLFSDNFIILMQESDNKKIEKRLKGMINEINAFNNEREFKYYLNFSAGVYHITDHTLSITAMEDRAHTARKNGNSNQSDLFTCSFYDEEIQLQLLKEKDFENTMWDSLRRNEFEVYLQPKYLLKDKKIYGAEALIRWNHPDLGFLPPSEFIPLFEKNGFIVDLDLFVFEQTCALLQRWLKEGKTVFPISINMSRVHFANTNFLDEYIRIRNAYEVPAEYLELELTETMVFENPKAFRTIIEKIHEAGFSCSMDDFGSGYSSLNMLKDLELDTVKLDRAFFSSKKMDNKKENVIVKSIINMTKELSMATVAEGIETIGQMKFLNNTECDFIQGYIISKPVSIQKFETLLSEQQKK